MHGSKFGTGTRNQGNSMGDSKNVPGPGHYANMEFVGKEGSKASMKFRPSTASKTIDVPGPGAYNPDLGAVRNSTPGSKIGLSIRDSFK